LVLAGPALRLLTVRRRRWRQFDAAARRLDCRAGPLGNEQALHGDFALDLASEDHLGPAGRRRHHPGGLERREVDGFRAQPVQVGQTDLRSIFPQGDESMLREPALQRHLSALEADLVVSARTRLLALVAAPRRLAMATESAAYPFLALVGARGRSDLV